MSPEINQLHNSSSVDGQFRERFSEQVQPHSDARWLTNFTALGFSALAIMAGTVPCKASNSVPRQQQQASIDIPGPISDFPDPPPYAKNGSCHAKLDRPTTFMVGTGERFAFVRYREKCNPFIVSADATVSINYLPKKPDSAGFIPLEEYKCISTPSPGIGNVSTVRILQVDQISEKEDVCYRNIYSAAVPINFTLNLAVACENTPSGRFNKSKRLFSGRYNSIITNDQGGKREGGENLTRKLNCIPKIVPGVSDKRKARDYMLQHNMPGRTVFPASNASEKSSVVFLPKPYQAQLAVQ